MRKTQMRADGRVTGLLVGAVIVTMSLAGCASTPRDPTSGTCCQFSGPIAYDCAAIENLGPGADLDGRCDQVNQGQSCTWLFSNDECCQIAVDDGYGDVTCGEGEGGGTSGTCCRFTGTIDYDCASIENLGPGGDLDGRCNAVNQGNSCSWFYSAEDCCEIAVNDGFPGDVQCN